MLQGCSDFGNRELWFNRYRRRWIVHLHRRQQQRNSPSSANEWPNASRFVHLQSCRHVWPNDLATITVTIQGTNDAPTAVVDTAIAVEAGGVSNDGCRYQPNRNVYDQRYRSRLFREWRDQDCQWCVAGTAGSAAGNVASSVTGTYGSINIAANGSYTYTVDNSNATVQALRTSGQTISMSSLIP